MKLVSKLCPTMLVGMKSLYPDAYWPIRIKCFPFYSIPLSVVYCNLKHKLQEAHCCLRLIDLGRTILIKFRRLLHKRRRAHKNYKIVMPYNSL